MEKNNLTERQKRFADYYVETGNASEAYRKAGYSDCRGAGVNAAKLLKNTKIQKYVETRLEQAESERVASVQEILEYLTRGMRQELTEEVVVTVGHGNGFSSPEVITKKISIKDSNKCAEMLAKRFGIFDNSQTITVITPQFLGDDELED